MNVDCLGLETVLLSYSFVQCQLSCCSLLPRDAMHSMNYAVARCLFIRLSSCHIISYHHRLAMVPLNRCSVAPYSATV